MNPWDPDSYLRFESERTMPSRDLAARIDLVNPKRIVDVGCGPGNSTHILSERWPNADISGLDNSEEMIRKAKTAYPGMKWILADAAEWVPDRKFDIVFSNAALQWIPDHGRLIRRLFDQVGSGGALAVQVPANNESPFHKAVLAISEGAPWKLRMDGCSSQITYNTEFFYYDLLSSLTTRVELWITTYLHILAGHQELIEWFSSTGLRSFLSRLENHQEREEFKGQILQACKSQYPIQADGKLIFPFKRLFFIAYQT